MEQHNIPGPVCSSTIVWELAKVTTQWRKCGAGLIFGSEPPEQGQHGVEAGNEGTSWCSSAYLVGDGVLAATSRLAECPASVIVQAARVGGGRA